MEAGVAHAAKHQVHGDPLPYHTAIRDYLKQAESSLWQRFSSNRAREENAASVRFDLLKSTYRIARSAQTDLYAIVDQVAAELGLEQTRITIYQAQNPEGLNASLAYIPGEADIECRDSIRVSPGEAHIVLHGPIGTTLSEAELRALFAHELGHILLYRTCEGDLLVAEQVLAALTHDRHADTSHSASARLFALYTEVFCDRIAVSVTGQPLDVISMLLKLATGVDSVDPQSYLEQASEIIRLGPQQTEGVTHPEEFVRAHVLRLWCEGGNKSNEEVVEFIDGRPRLDDLDLIAKQRMVRLTQQLIDALLAPAWLQTDVVIAHARSFFPGYDASDQSVLDDSLKTDIAKGDRALQDYCCYVMLDFATADRELEQAPLAHAIGIAESLGLQERFGEIATKELRLRKQQLQQISTDRLKLIQAAAHPEG